jgi:hypothetical protein
MPNTPPSNKQGHVRDDFEGEATEPTPVRPWPPTPVEQVYGCLAYDGPPISIEDMDEAVMREALKHK